MAKRGAPTKLTAEVQEAILGHVVNGATIEVAAAAEGFPARTVWRWLSKGREGKEPYAGFSQAIATARATFEIATLEQLTALKSSRVDPKIASALVKSLTWLLERTRRERYGSQITVKVAEAKEHLLDVVERVCTRLGETAVLVEILEELERGGPPEAGEAEERPVVH